MPSKDKREVSIRGTTHARLREYVKRHQTQMRVVVDDLINRALDEAESKASGN